MRTAPLAATIATDGLWLIGLGAFLVVLVALIPRPPRLHLQFRGQGDERVDRVSTSVTTAGLLATAAGSVLVAVGSTPSAWFMIATIIAVVLSTWLLIARQVRALWMARRDEAAMKLKENQDLEREAWELQAATLLARWRWALSHPLTRSNAINWPDNYLRNKIGDAPPGIPPEWYSAEGRQLRRSQTNLVRMTADEAPDWLRDIVTVALNEGWFVLGTPTVIAFYTPSGTQYETVVLTEHTLAQSLLRRNLLRKLRELGFPTHYGTRGQSLPAHDTGELVQHLVEANRPERDRIQD